MYLYTFKYVVPINSPYVCPPGTYGIVTAGESAAQACTACSPGYQCGGPLANIQQCGPGGYCPGGSASPTGCPPGTRSLAVGQISSATCTDCPAGSYCMYYGSTTGQLCPAGIAPLSSIFSTMFYILINYMLFQAIFVPWGLSIQAYFPVHQGHIPGRQVSSLLQNV